MRGLFERAGSPNKKVTIRTYGVPEMHDIRDGLKRRFKPRRVAGSSEAATCRNDGNEAKASSLLGLLVVASYYAGRPLGLGDKLEVLVDG
jgi:hypothetical protein